MGSVSSACENISSSFAALVTDPQASRAFCTGQAPTWAFPNGGNCHVAAAHRTEATAPLGYETRTRPRGRIARPSIGVRRQTSPPPCAPAPFRKTKRSFSGRKVRECVGPVGSVSSAHAKTCRARSARWSRSPQASRAFCTGKAPTWAFQAERLGIVQSHPQRWLPLPRSAGNVTGSRTELSSGPSAR